MGSSSAAGGPHLAARAESILISTEAEANYVIILLDILTENLENPVQKVFYRADPEQARAIANTLVRMANRLDGEPA